MLEHAGYADAKSRRSEDQDEQIGVGVACSTSESGVGAFEWARVVAERDGTFSAFSGIASVGQGLRTALSQVLADEFAVPLERTVIRHHDTDEVEAGEGAFGDRGMIFGAGAILLAVADLRENARRLAAARLAVEADAVEIVGDRAVAGDASVSLGELDASGVGRYEPGGPTHLSFCAAVAQVSVDRATGKVTLRRYTGGYDPGRAVNPLVLEGQFTGAAAQGIAGALFEESAYDESGQPLAATFMDYILPTMAELPEIESLVFEYPEPANPLGVKGAGNAGIICTHAAVANAVADALGPDAEPVVSLPLRASAVRALIRAGETGQ